MALKYPAETFGEAVDLAIDGANKLRDFVNGDIDTVIQSDVSGSIPSIAKALNEAGAYKSPTPWVNGEVQTDLMQPRDFNGLVYVPRTVPVTLGLSPTLGASGDWRHFGDAYLRQDLSSEGGIKFVGNGAVEVKSLVGPDGLGGPDSLIDATWPVVGMTVRTLGYYTPGDGGGNDYEIVAAGTGTDDGGSYIDLSGSGFQASSLDKDSVDIAVFGVDSQNPLSRALSSGASVITNKSHKNLTQSESVTLAGVHVDLNGSSLSFASLVGPAVVVSGDGTTIKRCRIYGPGVGESGIGVYISGEAVLRNIRLHQVEVSDFPLNGIFVDGVTDSFFSELRFYNNQFSTTTDFTGNFRIDNSSEVIVDNVHLENFYGKGVAFAFSEKCVLRGLTARNAQDVNSMAFYITGGSNRISVSSFTMDDSLNEGFKISRGSYSNSITSGVAVGGARGFQIQGSSRNVVSGLYVRNSGGGYAMRINSHDATNTGANDNVISGCVFEKEFGTTPCILIDPSILVSERNLITSCVIKSNTIGVRIEGLAKDFLISSSRIETTGNCVYSPGGSERLVIDSCVLSRESGAEVVTLGGADESVSNCKITHKGGSFCVAIPSSGAGVKVMRNELITSGTTSVNVHPDANGFVAAFNVDHAVINDQSTGGIVSNNVSL